VLRVDATVHAAEVARFTRFVVRGPGPRDCWLWVGAIADDGYGRFWLNRNGHKHVVRPHRYALALAPRLPLGEHDIVMHEVCDLPLCVRAEAVGGHLEVGTQAQNPAQMGRAGRGGGRGWPHRWYGLDRAQRATRSRALRDAVRDGWDPEAVRKALEAAAQPALFCPGMGELSAGAPSVARQDDGGGRDERRQEQLRAYDRRPREHGLGRSRASRRSRAPRPGGLRRCAYRTRARTPWQYPAPTADDRRECGRAGGGVHRLGRGRGRRGPGRRGRGRRCRDRRGRPGRCGLVMGDRRSGGTPRSSHGARRHQHQHEPLREHAQQPERGTTAAPGPRPRWPTVSWTPDGGCGAARTGWPRRPGSRRARCRGC